MKGIAEISVIIVAVSLVVLVAVSAEILNLVRIKKAERLPKNPLSEENKEILSAKIKSINAKSDKNELRDYVRKMLGKDDSLYVLVEAEAFEADVKIAKDFRGDCQKLIDTGLELAPERVFAFEDKFFNEYRKLKVLKLAECDDIEKVRSVLRSVHKTANDMVEYLMNFSKIKELNIEKPESQLTGLKAKVSVAMDQYSSDSEERSLGSEVLRLCDVWDMAMKTGAVDEFSETDSILITLAINYIEVIDGKQAKEAFLSQLKKTSQDISLLGKLAKMRVENKDT